MEGGYEVVRRRVDGMGGEETTREGERQEKVLRAPPWGSKEAPLLCLARGGFPLPAAT